MAEKTERLMIQRQVDNGKWVNWDWINRWTTYPEEYQLVQLQLWIAQQPPDGIQYRIVRRITSYEPI